MTTLEHPPVNDIFNTTISDLQGRTLTAVDKTDDEIVFHVDDGTQYKMYHRQNCCENVYIEDVAGDLEDLVGSPILMAEEVVNGEDAPPPVYENEESYTWTFYKLATTRGYVTIRWYGSSNGWYSESVSMERTK